MTKTVTENHHNHHGIQKDIQDHKNQDEDDDSNESSNSPPLVLKYLQSLPPEREVTLTLPVVVSEDSSNEKFEFKKPKVICEVPSLATVASVVKDSVVPEDGTHREDEFEEEEEEECLRIIEETLVDVSTLPGRLK